MPCSELKVNQRSGKTSRLYLQGWIVTHAKNQNEAEGSKQSWNLCIWSRHLPLKRSLTSNAIHGVISQKAELFITTAVRTSNPMVQQLVIVILRSELLYSISEFLRISLIFQQGVCNS
jgi:hypothetical protein